MHRPRALPVPHVASRRTRSCTDTARLHLMGQAVLLDPLSKLTRLLTAGARPKTYAQIACADDGCNVTFSCVYCRTSRQEVAPREVYQSREHCKMPALSSFRQERLGRQARLLRVKAVRSFTAAMAYRMATSKIWLLGSPIPTPKITGLVITYPNHSATGSSFSGRGTRPTQLGQCH